MNIRSADPDDVSSLVRLINAAFAVESFFKRGDRTNPDAVRSLLNTGVVLVAELSEALGASESAGEPVGSVYVELRGDRTYMGMLSVQPGRQGAGIGRMLMGAAEQYGRAHGCVAADVTVVNLRTELPPFYRNLGYVETGTAPFDRDEPTTQECHFIIMSKPL